MSKKQGSPDPVLSSEAAEELGNAGRFRQVRIMAGLVHRTNPRALPIIAASGLGTLAVLVVVGLLTGLTFAMIPIGVLLGLLVAAILFGRYAQAAQYAAVEGQLGAAWAVLETLQNQRGALRGNWKIDRMVAANRNLDMVHRAVGRPGVILVGEGSATGVASLLATEKKKVARVAHEVPIYDFQVGNGEGQVPLRRLQRKIIRLPRNLKPGAVSDLNSRLKALQPSIQGPKGPIPRGARMPKMPRPRMR